ncbi:polyprenyl synthetase family protein [Lentzea sp. NPDC006480]|uniref:polyprenyl synthetase family protein n=1 Tax=Lentzea sp. NPDC006480 TaxID=3157176 RepID=UPI0033BBC790
MNNSLVRESKVSVALDDVRARVQPVLRSAVDSLPEQVRAVAGYHFGWCDQRGASVVVGRSSGKMIRPALVIFAAKAVARGGDPWKLRASVLRAAGAIELVHNFSLVHDDAMDGDAMRHHRETVWKAFGFPIAILAGDALLALANQILTSDSSSSITPAAVEMLNDAVQKLVEGQFQDLAFERTESVGLEECLHMASRKTSSLMAVSCRLGGLFGGGTTQQVEALHAFGTHLGLAFQLADDLMGLSGDPSSTGKPANNDLWSRKKSLPVVFALNSETDAAHELITLYRKDSRWEQADVDHALVLIEQAGGVEWAQAEASRCCELAISCLRGANLRPDAAEVLADLVRLSAKRVS